MGHWVVSSLLHWLLHRLLNWLMHLRILYLLLHRLLQGLRLILGGGYRRWLYMGCISKDLIVVAIILIEAWLRVSNLWGRGILSRLHKRLWIGRRVRICSVQSDGRLLVHLTLFPHNLFLNWRGLFSRTRWLILALAATNDDNNSSSNDENTNYHPSNQASTWAWVTTRGPRNIRWAFSTARILEALLNFQIKDLNPLVWRCVALSCRETRGTQNREIDAVLSKTDWSRVVCSSWRSEKPVWVDFHHNYVLPIPNISFSC